MLCSIQPTCQTDPFVSLAVPVPDKVNAVIKEFLIYLLLGTLITDGMYGNDDGEN